MQPKHATQTTVSPTSIANSPTLSSSSSSSSSDFRNFEPHSDSGCEEEDDDERLASLEALRFALHHAPFSCNLHTLLPVPELLDWNVNYPLSAQRIAIRIENVSNNDQLDSLSMDVPQGGIYILLGSGHSGKSALLRCILGTVKLTSGSIQVFKSGERKRKERLSAICVGYMPQNDALYQELTVNETLQHYGRLYQLPVYVIRERADHLMNLVCLYENKHTLVRELNANRKWRLSLAVALIHSPPLLLLDEPTHNLDPLIRRSIWGRLERLCKDDGTTVLATSQYPACLEYANNVGLMRNGHVYEEGTPQELLDRFNCDNFEQMFMTFCTRNVPRKIRPSIAPYLITNTSHNDQDSQEAVPETASGTNSEPGNCSNISNSTSFCLPRSQFRANSFGLNSVELSESIQEERFQDGMFRRLFQFPMADWPIGERRRSAYTTPFVNVDLKRVFALLLKNILILRGNVIKISTFYFLFPAIQVIFVCCIFGRPLHRIPVSVPGDVALGDAFGPTFVHSYLDSKIFSIHYTDGVESAVNSVKAGKSWAAIVPWTQAITNSSQSCLEKFSNNSSAQPFGVRLYLDQSNYLVSQQIFYSFIGSMRRFLASPRSASIVSSIWNGCLLSHNNRQESTKLMFDWVERKIADSRLNHSAFKIHQVIYGSTDFRFLSFILPGFLMCFVYTYSLVLSAYLFLRETVSGLAERALISGTSGIELLLAHTLSMAILSFTQICFLLFIVFWLFGLPSQGPFLSLWALILLQGSLGYLYGLFVAVMVPRPKVAALCISAFLIPGFFFSGIVWPIESMNPVAQRFANILPVTLPVNALRYILSRGRDMHFEPIVSGFTVLFAHMGVVAFLTVAVFKFKTMT